METELKPCPFCGGTRLGFSSKTVARKYGSHRAYHGAIYCKDCNAYGARALSETVKNVYPMPKVDFDGLESRAIEAWNRRAEEPGWVPVALGFLPEEHGRYLCIVKSFAFPGSTYQAILQYDKYGFIEGCIYTDDVVYWMPLPEHPKL